jgi:VWFA-related protein
MLAFSATLMRHGRSYLLWLLAATICVPGVAVGLATPCGSPESSTLTFHSSVSEVRLVFFATDDRNHPVDALQRDDFAVVDNENVIRAFRSFTRSNAIKLDVVLLVDASESVQAHFAPEIAAVQQMISQWPWSPEDNVSVLSFSGTEPHFVCSGNCRSSLAIDKLASVSRGGTTPLFDAVEMATYFLIQRRQPDLWPVIILFSDGGDTISKTSFNEVLEKILASEEQIYVIDVGGSSDETATLQRFADESGGRYFPFRQGGVEILRAVIDDLHSARMVTYVPPESQTEFHSVRILPTHNLKLNFRCRQGYRRPSGNR